MKIAFSCTFLALVFSSVSLVSAVDFESEIYPVLKSRCGKCHMEGEAKGKVALDKHLIHKELDGGSIVPGNVKKSDLHWTMTLDPDDDSAMPPKGKRVPKEEISLIAKWIEEGAKIESSAPKPAAAPTTPEAPAAGGMAADTMGDSMGDDSMGGDSMGGAPPAAAAPAKAKPYKGVFKNHEGMQLTATLDRLDGNRAILILPDGKEYRYPIAMFSEESKKIVKQFKNGTLAPSE